MIFSEQYLSSFHVRTLTRTLCSSIIEISLCFARSGPRLYDMQIASFSIQTEGSNNVLTRLLKTQPPIIVDENGGPFSCQLATHDLTLPQVGTIGRQANPLAEIWPNGPLGVTSPTPLHTTGESEHKAMNRVILPDRRPSSRLGCRTSITPRRILRLGLRGRREACPLR